MFKKRFYPNETMQNENCGIKEFDYRFIESKPTIQLITSLLNPKPSQKPYYTILMSKLILAILLTSFYIQ